MTKAPLFFCLDVKVLEDLHTGAGTGSGDIDALVLRDRLGKPVIRASHLKGLLREAGDELIELERITQDELEALLGHDVFDRTRSATKDENKTESGGEHNMPNQTRSTSKEPRRAALRLSSLRIPKNGKCETLVWGSSAREENSRRPADETLRYVEHVAAGTQFKGEGFLDDPSLKDVFEKLLRRIDRMGGNRNRGAGLVKLSLEWSQLEKNQVPVQANGATRLRLVLRNLEPLCLPTTAHPGNLIPSHSFIRGQSLRGALMAWAIRRMDKKEMEEIGKHMARVSVGDALPLPDGMVVDTDVLPIPISIMTKKPHGGRANLPWWAQGAKLEMSDELGKVRDSGDEKPKRPGGHEYLCRPKTNDSWLRYSPEMNVRLRNQTPKNDSKAEAILFSVEEISEDTLFQSDLVFDDKDEAKSFAETFALLLSGGDWLSVGRGGQPMRVEGVHWTQIPESAVQEKSAWTLTLASDLILRGPTLGFLDDLDVQTLCELAGVNAEKGWSIADRFVETETIHGFNAVSGMHRSPAVAIRRGSCWKITGDGSAKLASKLWEKQALGERTREGCGRFMIEISAFGKLGKPERAKSALNENRQEFLLSRAKGLSKKCKEGGPSLSQLQWLCERALAATANANNDTELTKLLIEIEEAPRKRPQGGSGWKPETFPISDLRNELNSLPDLREKGLLISFLVQWLVPQAKSRRKKHQ